MFQWRSLHSFFPHNPSQRFQAAVPLRRSGPRYICEIRPHLNHTSPHQPPVSSNFHASPHAQDPHRKEQQHTILFKTATRISTPAQRLKSKPDPTLRLQTPSTLLPCLPPRHQRPSRKSPLPFPPSNIPHNAQNHSRTTRNLPTGALRTALALRNRLAPAPRAVHRTPKAYSD